MEPWVIRLTEEHIERLFKEGLKGTVHLCYGQEVADVDIISSYKDNNALWQQFQAKNALEILENEFSSN